VPFAQIVAQLLCGAHTLHQIVNNLNVLFLIVVMGQSNGKHKS